MKAARQIPTIITCAGAALGTSLVLDGLTDLPMLVRWAIAIAAGLAVAWFLSRPPRGAAKGERDEG